MQASTAQAPVQNSSDEAQALEDNWRVLYHTPKQHLTEREARVASRVYRSSFPFMSLAELQENSPSRRHGVEWQAELKFRKHGIMMVLDIAKQLKLNDTVTVTAQVLYHRYFARASLKTNCRLLIGCASVLLACKACSSWRSLDHVARAYQLFRSKKIQHESHILHTPALMAQVEDHLQTAERSMLYALNFDVNVHLPMPTASVAIEAAKLGWDVYGKDAKVMAVIKKLVDESYKRSVLCLTHPPEALTAAALTFGAAFCKKEVLVPDGRTLPEFCGTIEQAMNEVLYILNTTFKDIRPETTAAATASDTAVPVPEPSAMVNGDMSSVPTTRQPTVEEGELPAADLAAQPAAAAVAAAPSAAAQERPASQQAAPMQASAAALDRQQTVEEGEVPSADPSAHAAVSAAGTAPVQQATLGPGVASPSSGKKRPHSATTGHAAQARPASATGEAASVNPKRHRVGDDEAMDMDMPAFGNVSAAPAAPAAPAASTNGAQSSHAAAQASALAPEAAEPALQPTNGCAQAQQSAPEQSATQPGASAILERGRDDADSSDAPANGDASQLASGSGSAKGLTPMPDMVLDQTVIVGCAAASVAAPTASEEAVPPAKRSRTGSGATCSTEGPETPSPSASPTPTSNGSPQAAALVARQGADGGAAVETPAATQEQATTGVVPGA